MDTTQPNNDLFAPPTPDELASARAPKPAQADMFAPPTPGELQAVAKKPAPDMFAPPTHEELAATKPTGKPPEMLPDEYFQTLGKKHGVDPEELKSLAPYFGAVAETHGVGETLGQAGKLAAGTASRIIGSPAQKAYIALQSNPKMQAALDELRETGNTQQPLLGKVGEAITSPLGAVGAEAGLAGRLATAGGIGAAFGLGESKTGEEARGALQGAAGGLIVGGAAEALGAGINKLGVMREARAAAAEAGPISKQVDIEEAVQKELARTGNSEKQLEDFVVRGDDIPDYEDLARKQLDPEALEAVRGGSSPKSLEDIGDELSIKRLTNFTEDLTGQVPEDVGEARKLLSSWADRQGGEDALAEKYAQFAEKDIAKRAIESQDLVVQGTGQFSEKAANFVSDRQYVNRHIDDRSGTKTAPLELELNQNQNKMAQAMNPIKEEQQSVFDLARKTGVDRDLVDGGKIYRALDSGSMASLSPEEVQVAEKIKNYFDGVKQYANGDVSSVHPEIKPLSIPEKEGGYIPHQLVDAPVIITRLQDRIATAEQELGRLQDIQRGAEWRQALQGNETVQELVRAANLFSKEPIESGRDLSNKLSEMMFTKQGMSSMETKARSALERQGGIPDFMLETNVYKLMNKYANNTLKHLYLREPVDKMATEAYKLEKLGDLAGAQFVRNSITGAMGGTRAGTAAAQWQFMNTQASARLLQMADRVGRDTVSGQALIFTKQLPDFILSLNHQIYPNMLAWSPHAIIQNMCQSMEKLAPELGGVYGYKTLASVAPKTALNFTKLVEESNRLGLMPVQVSRAGQQQLKEGIRRSALWNMSDAAVESAGKMGMFIFQKSEQMNRALVISVADRMSKDIASGSQAALASLNRFPEQVRNSVLADTSHIANNYETLAKYLNSTAAYNYSKASMSEFGQVMGPLFSTFSKWPTATAGDIIYQMRSRGVMASLPRNAEKYLLPWMILGQAQRTLLGAPEDMSDMQKKIVGREGLSGMSPIGTLKNVANGQMLVPPMARTASEVVRPLLRGDTDSAKNGLINLAKSYTPGAGIFRFVTQDALKYIDSFDQEIKGK